MTPQATNSIEDHPPKHSPSPPDTGDETAPKRPKLDSSPTISPGPSSPTIAAEPNPASETTITYPNDAPEEVTQRIERIVTFADSAAPRFAITNFPSNASWGSTPYVNDQYYCINEQPVAIWLQGSSTFLNLRGNAEKHSVALRPSTDAALKKARSLQHDLAKPRTQHKGTNPTVNAYHFNDDQVKFDNVYDATQYLLPWKDMEPDKMDATKLRPPDIVLIECLLRRFKPPGARSTTKNRWPKWIVSFELTHVALLYKTVRPPAPVPQESHFTM